MARQKKNEELAVARSVVDIAVGFVTSVEEAGGTIEDARRIFKDERLKRQLGELVMGKLKLALSPCQVHVPHLIPDWVVEVVEDVDPTKFDPKKLKFSGFLKEGEKYTDGETIRERAKEMEANFGLSDVPALLGKDGKGLQTIPAELRGAFYIVLTGTFLRGSYGGLYVPCLNRDGGGWYLHFYRLDYFWDGSVRLVSCE